MCDRGGRFCRLREQRLRWDKFEMSLAACECDFGALKWLILICEFRVYILDRFKYDINMNIRVYLYTQHNI